MAEAYKILAQLPISSYNASYDDLYDVPLPAATTVGSVEVEPKASSVLVETLVTSLVVCNRSAAVQLVKARLVSSDSTVSQLEWFSSVAVGGTNIKNLGLVLTPGDKLTVLVFSFGSILTDFTLFGVETTSGSGPN